MLSRFAMEEESSSDSGSSNGDEAAEEIEEDEMAMDMAQVIHSKILYMMNCIMYNCNKNRRIPTNKITCLLIRRMMIQLTKMTMVMVVRAMKPATMVPLVDSLVILVNLIVVKRKQVRFSY